MVFGLLLSGTASQEGIGDSYFPKDGNGGYDVGHYRLGIKYVPDDQKLEGHAVISARSTQRLASFNLDFGSLKINRLTVNRKSASWRRTGDHELVVTPGHPLASGRSFTVEIRYGGRPVKDGAVVTTADGFAVAGEPHAASDWFPSNDHPRDKASFDFAITVPEGLTAVANGMPAGTTSPAVGWTTWHWRQREPMATYLATAVVGRLRVVKSAPATGAGPRPAETPGAGPTVFSAVSESVPEERADAALGRTSEIADFFAERFGPYPFDAIGGLVVDAPRISFALETQTRPIYGLRFFDGSDPDRKTTVIAHEIAHQWYGNSVSLSDWRDIWLNEGLATYGEWLWTEHVGIATVNQLFDLSYGGVDAMWLPPPGDPGRDNLFAQSVYRRGAMTLHALRLAVGDEEFFQILRGWATMKRYGNGTTSEFVRLAERVSGQRLGSLFESWLYGTKRPPRPHAPSALGNAPVATGSSGRLG